MKNVDKLVYEKLETLSLKLESQLKNRGILVPFKTDDGVIYVGNYLIVKEESYFNIYNRYREKIVDKINLPQTAAILANNLALGKILDINLLNLDRYYGYAEFEEKLNKLQANQVKNIDRLEMFAIKSHNKKYKKELCKQQIEKQFKKLLQMYK